MALKGKASKDIKLEFWLRWSSLHARVSSDAKKKSWTTFLDIAQKRTTKSKWLGACALTVCCGYVKHFVDTPPDTISFNDNDDCLLVRFSFQIEN